MRKERKREKRRKEKLTRNFVLFLLFFDKVFIMLFTSFFVYFLVYFSLSLNGLAVIKAHRLSLLVVGYCTAMRTACSGNCWAVVLALAFAFCKVVHLATTSQRLAKRHSTLKLKAFIFFLSFF